MYKIVVTPDPILVKRAAPVKKFDKKLQEMISEMEETLISTNDPKGVGLAAPQVGISLRIFQMKPTDKAHVLTIINPILESTSIDEDVPNFSNSSKIEKRKPKKSRGKLLEGCLSIPNIWGNVTRHKEVTLLWKDVHGKHRKKIFKGFPAVIVQHELDHLNGILFTKHVMEQGERLYKSRKNEEGEDEFDEVKL